ncbi:MAG: hypothetical protein NT147_07820 [Candidatus Aminicenantes bacterium]|nr:hypothetical protein [Candidatus Aminicenantes bacterium]
MGKFRIRTLKKYADPADYEVAVETGTLFGDSASRLSRHFPMVYTIEIDRELFERASARFKNNDRIRVLHGDSKQVLQDLVKEIHQSCLFFLDAHFSGDRATNWKKSRWRGYRVDTGYAGDRPTAENQVPLFEEIKVIHDGLKSRCLIYIDDADEFDENGAGLKDNKFQGEDWSHLNLNSIRDYLSPRLKIWVKLDRQLIIELNEIPEG